MRGVAVALTLALVGCGSGRRAPEADRGVLDLRSVDFAGGTALALQGRWQFFWRQFVAPDAHPLPDGYLGIGRWGGRPLDDGRTVDGKGWATYRVRVLLPEKPELYRLHLEPIVDACRLWVTRSDGAVEGPIAAGEVGDSRQTSVGSLYPTDLYFTASGAIEITLQVSSFEHARSGSGTAPLFGTALALEHHQTIQRMGDLFCIGVLAAIGLYQLLLFVLRRREISALSFGMACLAMAFRAMVQGRYLQVLFPGLSFTLLLRLEYLPYYVALPLFSIFMRELFPRYVPRWFVRGMLVAGAFYLATLLFPMPIYSLAMPSFQAITVVNMLVFFTAGVGGCLRERDVVPMLELGGFSLALVAMVVDLVNARSFVQVYWVAHYGMSAFVLFHSLVLATLNQRRAKQLERHKQEMQQLNDELRRQVGERSRELSEALSRLPVTPEALVVSAGEVIEQRYRVVRRLGAGGMGQVHEVERLSDGRRLALKSVKGGADRTALARFAREAQIATQLNHPGVVAVLDVGVAPFGMYIVMELIVGSTLAGQQARYGDVRWALPILTQIARALAAMHEHGIVHRDLKPANILLEGPNVKVADFGIACLVDDEAQREAAPAFEKTLGSDGQIELTHTGAILGTPSYMAPELARGARDATPSADVWSFAVIAHELLAGRRPFVEPPVHARLAGRPLVAATPLANPAVEARLRGVLHACLDFDPAARPASQVVYTALAASWTEDPNSDGSPQRNLL